jgi:hypothetical protein
VSASQAEALRERAHQADELVSRLNPDAAEQSDAQPAVRQDSVSRGAAEGSLRPWVLPARWSRPEERRAGERDGAAPACWEPFRDRLGEGARAAKALAARRDEGGLPGKRWAEAGADRKESDRAWGPAEKAGREWEYPAAQPAGQKVVRQPEAAAAGRIEERVEERPRQELRGGEQGEPPLPVRAAELQKDVTVRRPGGIRLGAQARFPFPSIWRGAFQSRATRSILP